MSADLRQLLFGLAAARFREDRGGWAALWYGGDGPIDERRLLLTALDVIGDLASAQGAEELPSLDGEAVLRRWALEMAD